MIIFYFLEFCFQLQTLRQLIEKKKQMLFVTKVCVENDISIVIKLKHDNPINVTVTFAGNLIIFLKELIKNNFSQTLKSFLKHVMLNEIIFSV